MREPCRECGMTNDAPYLGEPVCVRYPEDRYTRARKIELAKAGCFKFAAYGEYVEKK